MVGGVNVVKLAPPNQADYDRPHHIFDAVKA